jgi:hypothetical protein
MTVGGMSAAMVLEDPVFSANIARLLGMSLSLLNLRRE